jgi:subtilisin family serine protease
MATPHVAGAVALMATAFPAENVTERISRILEGADALTSLNGKVVTGGRRDTDGDTLSISAVTSPANGTAIINETQILYTPDNDYTGADNFTYTISDGNGGTDTATVNVTVNADGGTTGGDGGGCTYNPNNKSFDLMFILMMMMSLFYPLRRKYLS